MERRPFKSNVSIELRNPNEKKNVSIWIRKPESFNVSKQIRKPNCHSVSLAYRKT